MSHTAYASDVDDCEHEEIYYIVANEINCGKDGVSIVDENGDSLDEVYYCDDCEQYFADEDCTEVVSVTVTYTDAIGHSVDNIGVTLIDVSDEYVFCNIDDDVIEDATVYECIDCGYYYMVVTDEDDEDSVSFEQVFICEDDYDSTDDELFFSDVENASALVLNTETTVEVENDGDSAWYSFTPSESQKYSFTINLDDEDDSSTLDIGLYDANGESLAWNGCNGTTVTLSYKLEAETLYYVAFSATDMTKFNVIVSEYEAPSDSGTVGTNCIWTLENDVLTIEVAEGYTTGSLAPIYSSSDNDNDEDWTFSYWPWADYDEENNITSVVIGEGVSAGDSLEGLFSDLSNVESIDASNLDVSNVTSMEHAFSWCDKLTTLDVSGWDTSNVTSMFHMFSYCSSLTSIDLSTWNTSSVTDMAYLFKGCTALEYINISGFTIPYGIENSHEGGDCDSAYGLFDSENQALRTVVLPASYRNTYETETYTDDDDDEGYTYTYYINALPLPYDSDYVFDGTCNAGWTDGTTVYAPEDLPDGAGTYVAVFDTNGDGVIDDSDENDTSGLNSGSTSGGSETTDPTSVSLSSAKVTLGTTSYTYDGSAKTPSVTVTLDGTTLTSGTDYTVSYSSNTNAGTATVTVTGTGNYTDTASTTFTINKASLSSAKVTLKTTSYTYNGKTKKPGISSVKVGSTTISSSGYTVSYKNNKNAGTATVTVTGTGNYTGSAKATFTIKKASQSSLKVTKKTKTVKYSKVKKKKQTVKAITKVSGAKGKVTYSITSAKKGKKSYKSKFSISKSTGKITVKKGTKKGTYKVKVKVTSAKTTNYKKATKTVTVTIKVK